MSYLTRWTVAQNGGVQQSIAMSLVAAAIAISGEVTSTANHANRVALAKQVAANPGVWAAIFAPGVVDNLAVETLVQAGSVTDAQLDGAISAIWNTYAGVV